MSLPSARPDESRPATSGAIATGMRWVRPLEHLVWLQVSVFVLLASWGFGGNAPWSRTAIIWWGSLGALLTLTALLGRNARAEDRWRAMYCLWPFVLFNLVVLASLLNPTFREVTMGREVLLMKTDGTPHWPGSAQPALAREALWLFDGIYLSCFNLALCVRRRRTLRALLLLAGANALALAVFGSVQKLSGATGLYFGLVPSPQNYFFASFIYHNHWGAFTLLMTALCLGLVVHNQHNREYRNFWHSPAFAGIIAVFFLAASIPLSGSRSCTLLVLVLLGGALLHWARSTVRQRRAERRSSAPPLLAAGLAVVVAIAAAYQLARPVIDQRIGKTWEQLAEMQARGGLGARVTLYRDTWHMARDRLPFGWGMASYPMVFYNFYNTQSSPADHLPVFYRDAHSDWLQSLAELGIIGTLLLGFHALAPLFALRNHSAPGALPGYLLAGCALIVLYAGIEFPFGNPAVVLAWWLCFFIAVRYARLDAHAEKT
jgi:O-antigen ligase